MQPPLPTAPGSSRSPSILHAESDEVFRRRLGEKLENAGWDVHPAPTAEAARDLLKAGAFDLIVLGHGLPGLNGLELAESIRQAGVTTPVIVAASGWEELRQAETTRLPALSAVLKPIDLTLFMGILQLTVMLGRWGY